MKNFLVGLLTLLTATSSFAANAPVIFGPGNSAQFLVPALMPPDAVTPPNPPASYHKMYIKPDHNLYILTPAGVETMVGTGGGSGTVTSVALALPVSVFSISGSPVIGAGTLTGSFVTQNANLVFAGPAAGGAAVPTFRSLVALDIPALDFAKITTGIVPIAQGGTGQATKTLGFNALSPNTTKGDIIVHNGTDNIRLAVGADTFVLTADATQISGVKWVAGGGGGGSGTVTSVDIAVPGEFSVSGNPITTAGTITIAKVNQNQNLIYSGPAAGAAAAPIFRALVPLDIPALDFSKITTGIVPIAQGGTGQATNQAGFDALSPLATKGDTLVFDGTNNVAFGACPDGQMIQFDSAQVDGIKCVAPFTGTGGTPLTFVGFDAAGIISSVPAWGFNADGAALISQTISTSTFGTINVASSNPALNTIANMDLYYENFTNAGTITGDLRANHFDLSGTTGNNLNGFDINSTVDVGGNASIFNANLSGTAGGDLELYHGSNSGNVANNVRLISVDTNGQTSGSMSAIIAGNSGPVLQSAEIAHFYNNGAITNQLNLLDIGNAQPVGANMFGMTIDNNGAVTGDLTGYTFVNGANVGGNLQIFNVGNNGGGPVVTGNATVFNGYNNANVLGNENLFLLNSNAVVTGNKTAMLVGMSGTSPVVRGLDLNLSVTSPDVQGANINVGGSTSPNQMTALNLNGGALNAGYTYDTANWTPAAEFQLHSIGGQLQISSGFPINAGQFGFSNNLGGQVIFNDDMGPSVPNIGWSMNGFVGLVAGAPGKTFDTLNFMLAGASDNGTGGTISHLYGFRTAGILPGATPALITEESGFYVDPLVDSNNATNKWGFRSDAVTADNWFSKNLVVGGATKLPTNASVGIELAGTTQALLFSRLTTVQKTALTAVDGMEVYDTTLNEFDCYQSGSWQPCISGGGTVTSVDFVAPAEFTVSGNPVTTAGTITLTKVSQNQNLIYSGPAAGAAAAPTFRALVPLDIPALDFAKITTGIVPITQGGTGQATATAGFNALSPMTTKGDVLVHDGTNNVRLPVGTDGFALVADSAAPDGVSWQSVSGTGTVTSVALTVPGFLSVAGSPVTTSGTLAVSLATQTANTVFAGPAAAGPTAPTFRTLVAADIPAISLTTGVSGILPIANGGTNGATALAAFNNLSPLTTKADLLTRDGSNNIRVGVGSDGQILIADSTQTSGLRWGSNSAVVSATTGFEPEVFVMNGGVSVLDDFDGVRRAENNKTIAKIVLCAKNSGLLGSTAIRVNYGVALASNVTLSLTANGGVACASSTPAVALSTSDLMNVDLTSVASGAVEDVSVKLLF